MNGKTVKIELSTFDEDERKKFMDVLGSVEL